jgi:galactokinase
VVQVDFRALASDFRASFFSEADCYIFSPGRINLMGEHIEYNGGHVFHCAITLGTYGAARKREDRVIRLYSKNFSEQGINEFTLDNLEYNPEHGWGNYPKGMLYYLKKNGHPLSTGFDLLISGNIPCGAGLSSSASLLMLVGEIVRSLYYHSITRMELIKIGKAVETEFLGTNSGIADLLVAALGKMNHALLLDSHTLSYDYISLNLKPYKMIIMDTNKPNDMTNLKYNERRDDCERALRHLQAAINIVSLADLNMTQFENIQHLIPDKTQKKRARHVVSENERTLKAVKELKRGNIAAFGKLINQSHLSLRNDFEITGIELDTLVEAAWQQPGVLGSKMIGAGLGGCAIALVEENEIDQFVERVGDIYHTRIGKDASFYTPAICDGVKALNVDASRKI